MFELLFWSGLGSAALAALKDTPKEVLLGGAVCIVVIDASRRHNNTKLVKINADARVREAELKVKSQELEIERLKLELKLRET